MILPRRSLSVLLAVCVLAASACAPALRDSPEVQRIVRLDEDGVRNVALLIRMEDGRALDAALVARLLEDTVPEIRARAVLAAGRVGDSAAVEFARHGLRDPDAGVRASAALAVGLLSDSSQAAIAVLDSLARFDAGSAAVEAVAVLGRIGGARARPTINAVLSDPATRAAVRHEALLAAWRLPRDSTTTGLVAAHLGGADAETRWRATYALMRAGGTGVVPHLIAAMSDTDALVRAQAARGLRASLVDSAGARTDALAALLRATGDAHPHVRINALRALPAYREPTRSTPVLVAAAADTDRNVAMAAVQALADSSSAAASATLRNIAMDHRTEDGLRMAALASWSRLEPTGALGLAGQWADSTRWLLRFNAARSAAAAPWPQGAALLERLARDRHDVVAAEALTSIRTAADSAPEARRIYIQALGAAGVLTRAAAVRGLAVTAGPAELDLLLQAYEGSRGDDSHEASLAAVEALGRLRTAGVPVERSFFVRFGDAVPRHAVTHAAIAAQLGPTPAAWGEVRRVPEPRPLAFYEDVVRRLVAPVLAGAAPPRVGIMTPHGEIVLELAAADAPLTVHSFLGLIERGYYEDTRWHRVVPNFVIQDGDPRGDGSGGPGYMIRDEINRLRYNRGALGMALSGPDTGGSQFFITHSPQPHLDGGYTIFGRVLDGMDAVDRVLQDEPIIAFRRLD